MPRKRKNPYGLAPLLLYPLGLAIGGTIGVGVGSYVVAAEDEKKIKNVGNISNKLYMMLTKLDSGQGLTDEEMSMKPTSVWQPPTNERQALVQAGFLLAQGAGKLATMDYDFSKLLDQAITFHDLSLNASETPLGASDSRLTQPLAIAYGLLSEHIATRSGAKLAKQNTDPKLIQEQLNFEESISLRQIASDTLSDTYMQSTKPLRIVGGLLTGERPSDIDPKTWQIIKVAVAVGGGLGLLGAITYNLRPMIELYAKKRIAQIEG